MDPAENTNRILAQILGAIQEQTAAINRLVELQAVLITVLADEQDPDDEPETYMNGKPAR